MPPIQVFAYLGKQNNLTCIWLTYPIKLIEMPFGVMYFSVDIFTFIFRFWLLMYTTPHCCCIKNFLRSLHKNILKIQKLLEVGVSIRPSELWPIEFDVLQLKCKFCLIRICRQYFWLNKFISLNIVFHYGQW